MVAEPVRAGAAWLALREPADAAARSTELVDVLLSLLPRRELVVHDLGCGSGAMTRWLAPRLSRPQRWFLHDRDAELLDRVDPAGWAVETQLGDVTRLDPAALAGADLVTASALLDMLTAEELERLVDLCATVGCPVLIALTVVGRVELHPAERLDREVMAAFNDHQRRQTSRGRLLGPDAVGEAVQVFATRGYDVVVRPSPWRLGAEDAELVQEWLSGWVAAAAERRPGTTAVLERYARRRHAAVIDRSLSVTVHHVDFLAVPAATGQH